MKTPFFARIHKLDRYESFLEKYFEGFSTQMNALHQPISHDEWDQAIQLVRSHSPMAGWMVSGCPSAPAAADPYILAYEAATFLLRDRKINAPPDSTVFVTAYNANLPPWRDDAASTFTLLQNNGINLHFISNSSTDTIQGRLKQLKGVANIPVNGGAAKYGRER